MNAEIISTTQSPSDFDSPSEEGSEAETRSIEVPIVMSGHRLDKCLAAAIPEFSRSYLQQLLVRGDVTLDGLPVTKVSMKVHAGQHILATLRPTPQATSFRPEPVRLDVVFEDEHIVVLNKPPGLVVHPAAGNWTGTVLNGLLMHHRGAADLPRAGIVHRLDKDTSGLMVVAKTRPAMDELGKQIALRAVQRYYLALAERPWRRGEGVVTVEQPIGRDPTNRLRMAVLRPDNPSGKAATTWVVWQRASENVTLLACKLFTGRTHQIRVHLSWLGHPICGDSTYGGQLTQEIQRQALHATRLDFVHPVTGSPLSFTAGLPGDMQRLLDLEGLNYNHQSIGPNTFGLPAF